MTVQSYGQVVHAERCWYIQCEPAVRSRLKRVFPRMAQGAADIVELKSTPENSRELQWFLQRYPMTMDTAVSDRLDAMAAEHVQMEYNIAELVAGRVPLPTYDLAKPARDYQRYAATQLKVRGGLLLADDLGLGKTISAICAMVEEGNLPAVVVYPAALPHHWPEKLAEFAPQLRVHHINIGQPYPLIKQPRQRRSDLWDTLPDVILVSYHKLRTWAETLAEISQLVVFEECQQLRNPGTGIHTACQHLASHSRLRLGLTATPIYNYGSEFYHVINVLLPDALGSYDEFLREWCIGGGGEKPKLKDPEVFGSYLRREGIMLRRTRKEVGRELPPLVKIIHEVEYDSAVMDRIQGDALALAKIIVKSNEARRGEKMQAAGELETLVRHATGVAKAPYVAEFVKLLLESEEKIILFGWHHDVYHIWKEALADYKPSLYTGKQSAARKKETLDAFVHGDSRVLIISLRAGSGIDGLQHVSKVVVFGEFDWSPGVHEQCMGRPHRDGALERVLAYFLMSNQGCDPLMMDVLGVKREQIEGVRNPDDNLIERLDTGGANLRILAEKVLKDHNVVLPASSSTAPLQLEFV
ncbi:DEAD/DEAH box helicase [Pseudomonas viridiflava]|uniref:SNF2-related protein n=1 Tax=Pseudomonas viridiflava TaxID=33069 RepID=UPI000F042B45|nr:DEAD/DEAH box helicase [Pseudomonas viridiflava]